MAISSNEFKARIEKIDVRGRPLMVRQKVMGTISDNLYVNFFNVPSFEVSGADKENNRIMVEVRGFDKSDLDAPAEKLRLELMVSVFPRDRGFRAKNAKAETILAFLTEFLEGIARDFEPGEAIPRRSAGG